MAIESAVFLRRVARIMTLVLIVVFAGCVSIAPASAAAPPTLVMAGSIIPNQNTLNQYGQIYRIVVANNGAVLFLDTQNGGLYELKPGATTLITLSAAGSVLKGGGNFWNAGMALDNSNPQNLYVTGEYGPQPDFYRVSYDASTGTWPLTGSDAWTAGDTWLGGEGGREVAFDDNNNMYVSTEGDDIYELSISADGSSVGAPNTNGDSSTSPILLVKNLTAEAAKMTVDHAGDVFFIEDPWEARSKVDVGVWEIPAGTSGQSGVSGLTRFDPPAAGYNFKGVSVDAAGDVYLSSSLDTGGATGGDGNENGVIMVPNESGDPLHPSFSSTWSDAVVVSPVTASAAVAIDPRGFLWIPTNTNGWTPNGSLTVPGTYNWVMYDLGSASLGSSPIGTAGATGIVWYTFSGNVTPSSIAVAQPGSGSDFSIVSTNPLLDSTATTPTVACTGGTAYAQWDTCPVWIAVNPRAAGPVSGQLAMLDASNDVLQGSAASVYGVGQGPGLSFLGSASASQIGSSFTSPGQVATDSLGNIYVADAGQKKVLEFPAGATSSTTPVSILSGLTAPTGVAVDGTGNVYIGDSGSVIEVPFQSGALNAAAKTTIQSGLGSQLNLAVGGAGNVYVADKANGRVVKIPNPSTKAAMWSGSTLTVGSGFTAPSAVAVDNLGNVFVADGTSLDEVSPWNGLSTITTKLAGSVTGLAVDPSGSVYVAQSGGVIWIPNETGGFNLNDVVQLTAGTAAATTYPGLLAPSGIALDGAGNQYVSSTGTPSLTELSVNGAFDFGTVSAPNPDPIQTDADILAYNVGNLPLTFSAFNATNDPFTNTDFMTETELVGDIPGCDPSSPTSAGLSCYLGLAVTPTVGSPTGVAESATGTILSNAPTVSLAVTADSVLDTRNATTTAITAIPASVYPGTATVTVTVTSASGTPTGNVSLRVTGHGTVVEPLVNGSVTFPDYTGLNGGTYNVTATYAGAGVAGTDPNFAKSVASAQFTVTTATPSVTVTPVTTPDPMNKVLYVALNSNATMTVNVSSTVGVPTGSVRFMKGNVPADPTQDPIPLDGNGNATFNTKNLALGTYNLTVAYQGDQNYAPVSISATPFQVINPSVLITASPSTLTLTPGVPGSATLNIESLVGFGGVGSTVPAINLQCDNPSLPRYSECTFSVTSTQVPNPGSTTVVMTISTNAPVNENNAASLSTASPWTLAGIFGFGLLGLTFRKKSKAIGRAFMIVGLMLLTAGAIFGVTACSNSGYTHTPPAPHVVTPSGTYQVGVVVTENGEVVSLPFTLTTTVQ